MCILRCTYIYLIGIPPSSVGHPQNNFLSFHWRISSSLYLSHIFIRFIVFLKLLICLILNIININISIKLHIINLVLNEIQHHFICSISRYSSVALVSSKHPHIHYVLIDLFRSAFKLLWAISYQ